MKSREALNVVKTNGKTSRAHMKSREALNVEKTFDKQKNNILAFSGSEVNGV